MGSLVRHLRTTTGRANRFERKPPMLAYHRRFLLTSAWLTAWESQNLKKERHKPEYRHLPTIHGSQHSKKFGILRTCARNGRKERLYRARRNKKLSRNVCGSTSINTHTHICIYIYVYISTVYRFKGTWCRGCGGLMIAVFIIRHRHLAVLALASSKSEYDPLRKAALLVLNLGLHHRPHTNGGGPVRLQCNPRNQRLQVVPNRRENLCTPPISRWLIPKMQFFFECETVASRYEGVQMERARDQKLGNNRPNRQI